MVSLLAGKNDRRAQRLQDLVAKDLLPSTGPPISGIGRQVPEEARLRLARNVRLKI